MNERTHETYVEALYTVWQFSRRCTASALYTRSCADTGV
jgi:hypothetical protein